MNKLSTFLKLEWMQLWCVAKIILPVAFIFPIFMYFYMGILGIIIGSTVLSSFIAANAFNQAGENKDYFYISQSISRKLLVKGKFVHAVTANIAVRFLIFCMAALIIIIGVDFCLTTLIIFSFLFLTFGCISDAFSLVITFTFGTSLARLLMNFLPLILLIVVMVLALFIVGELTSAWGYAVTTLNDIEIATNMIPISAGIFLLSLAVVVYPLYRLAARNYLKSDV